MPKLGRVSRTNQEFMLPVLARLLSGKEMMGIPEMAGIEQVSYACSSGESRGVLAHGMPTWGQVGSLRNTRV